MERDWRRGWELLKSGEAEAACRVLQEAATANPESFEAHFYLGTAEAMLGHFAQARASFQRALSLKRDHAPSYFNLGLIFEKEGRLREAMAHYQQALRYSPGHVPARQAVARLAPHPRVEIPPPPPTPPPPEAGLVVCKLCGMETRQGDACEWCHKPLQPVPPRAEQPSEQLQETYSAAVQTAQPELPIPSQRSRRGVPDPTATMGLPVVRGRLLPEYRHSTGFWDSLSRGWVFIRNAYALAFEKKFLLLPILLGGMVNLAYSAFFLAIAFMSWQAAGKPTGDALDQWGKDHRVLLLLLSIMLLFGSLLIGYFFMGMTVSMVDAYLKGREPNVRVAWQDALKNFGAICALAVVGTLVELIVSALRRQRRDSGLAEGAVLGALAAAIEAAWTVLSFLLLPVIMIEDTTLGNALARVRDIHRRNLLPIAVGEVGLRIVNALMGTIFVFLLFGLGAVLFPYGIVGIAFFVVITVVGIAVLNLINAFARATYYTCLYLWAVELEHAPVPSRALVPAPLAAALG